MNTSRGGVGAVQVTRLTAGPKLGIQPKNIQATEFITKGFILLLLLTSFHF